MHLVEPQVFMIAETRMMNPGLFGMLAALETKWQPGPSTPSELLVEVAGRLCYKSFEVGLNPNVTKVREGNHEYIGNILKQKHGSVIEHSSTTAAFIGVSRVFTHELVRHRAGCAYSQESMRFVRLDDVGMYMPDCIKSHPNKSVQEAFNAAVVYAEKSYDALVDMMISDDMPFSIKKEITSALRRIAPGGHTTNIIMTANHRSWRHLIEMRTAEGAEEEIVKVFMQVADFFSRLYPAFYQDMTWVRHTKNPSLKQYVFANSKI